LINGVLSRKALAYAARPAKARRWRSPPAPGSPAEDGGHVPEFRLGNAVNPLTSLNAPFRIPTLLSPRGGVSRIGDEPQQ